MLSNLDLGVLPERVFPPVEGVLGLVFLGVDGKEDLVLQRGSWRIRCALTKAGRRRYNP